MPVVPMNVAAEVTVARLTTSLLSLLAEQKTARPFEPANLGDTYRGRDLAWTLRPAYLRWANQDRLNPLHDSRELTGGALLTLRGPYPAWGHAYNAYQHERRLRPGWTRATLERQVTRLMYQAVEEVFRQEEVEVVWRLEERTLKSDGFLALIRAEEACRGHDTSYDTMSVDDARHYRTVLTAWRREHPEDCLEPAATH